ncbi:54S ribosomal protein yml6, mitochondrial [Kalmusia sp. IMI 367209]|nr:54S ribosomal protein yml6, mitochondrial [Kalmusia sp. IMI 367209]
MASPRIATPMRGVSFQLSRLSLRQDAVPKSLSSSFARSITTSTSLQAAVSSITTSVDGYVPVKPFEEQSVLATIHKFPSLEPLRLERYPSNQLNLPTRKDILHRAVIYEGDKTRSSTASTKTRYEIRGSAKKIRPQKGSGRARLGDKKSPMLRGGGVAHGPKPRDFSTGLQKKVYDLAWRTALSYRYRKGELIIVDNAIELESPSQRLLTHIFDLHERERGRGRSLLVTSESRPLLEQTLDRMDRRRQALTWEEVDVKDLLELSRIIIERRALRLILNDHQSDLTPTKSPFHSFGNGLPTQESIPGWAEFRALMLASPAERDTVRADAYESVAFSRWQRAESLPQESTEKLTLTISAYELLAEAKDLRRAQLPTFAYLEHVFNQAEDRAATLTDAREADEAAVEAGIAQLTWRETVLQSYELLAQAAEHRRDAYRWKKEEILAEREESDAGDARTDVAEAELDVLRAKKELAQARAQVCINNQDHAGARKWQGEAEELEAQEQAVVGEEELEHGERLEEEIAKYEAEEKKSKGDSQKQ